MFPITQIDSVIRFQSAHGVQIRGTIVSLQRNSLVMEIYNPTAVLQISEVLTALTVRIGQKTAYQGKAVVISLVNTGLTAVVSVTLIDEWRDLREVADNPAAVGAESRSFVHDWEQRFQIRKEYQIVVNEMRAFLSDASRWVEQIDLASHLPREGNRLRLDVFEELARPIGAKIQEYSLRLEAEAARVDEATAPVHRQYTQAALHPLILRAPFVFRTYTKPLGYAGDYEMVNQILSDPREGPTTYFQIVNATFLHSAVAAAHRNRIDLLVQFLTHQADRARAQGRQFRVFNVGCGPAVEIQRFIAKYEDPGVLAFTLLDFSEETIEYTRRQISDAARARGVDVDIDFRHHPVQDLLKRHTEPPRREFDAIYCAGLFDYLADKVCARLLNGFAARTIPGGRILATNVHARNPERYSMEHMLEWYLVYRDEAKMASLMPAGHGEPEIYTDATGVNVFVEGTVSA